MIYIYDRQPVEVVGTWELVVHDQCAEEGVDLLAWDIPDKCVRSHQTVKNALVDSGIDVILRRCMEGASLAVFTMIQLGTSAAAFARTQTGCTTPITTGGLAEAAGTLTFFARLSGGGFMDRASLSKSFTATADHDVAEACVRSTAPRCLNRIVAAQHVNNTQVFTATFNIDINTT